MQFFIVGIDGRSTPDPEYWFDRWECIRANSASEALSRYYEMRKGWLRTDEKPLVKVHAVLTRYIPARTWLKEVGWVDN